MQGGSGSKSESLIHPDIMPDKLESGTANAVGIAGLLEGVRYIQKIGIEKSQESIPSCWIPGFVLKEIRHVY